MWLFTLYGFFSVSAVRSDGGMLAVRARDRQHLENLKARFPRRIGQVFVDYSADYTFRVLVRRKAWARMAAAMTEEMTWSNVKAAAAARPGLDANYVDAMHAVWSLMRGIDRGLDKS